MLRTVAAAHCVVAGRGFDEAAAVVMDSVVAAAAAVAV
jgi:hypothetical protein